MPKVRTYLNQTQMIRERDCSRSRRSDCAIICLVMLRFGVQIGCWNVGQQTPHRWTQSFMGWLTHLRGVSQIVKGRAYRERKPTQAVKDTAYEALLRVRQTKYRLSFRKPKADWESEIFKKCQAGCRARTYCSCGRISCETPGYVPEKVAIEENMNTVS